MILPAIALGIAALSSPAIDAPAPRFDGPASSGRTISIEEFKGKTLVLEWTNDECPFVRKHYDSGNMQATQAAARKAGAVWITVISSAPGKQGFADAPRANQLAARDKAEPDYILLDPTGAIGRAYGAKTTPHMFIIDGAGTLRYDGAIDDQPSADRATVPVAQNHVLAALGQLSKGERIAPSQTKPYGCSVKYGS